MKFSKRIICIVLSIVLVLALCPMSVFATEEPGGNETTEATDSTSTDPTSTDPTSTDPTSTDPTSTDPTEEPKPPVVEVTEISVSPTTLALTVGETGTIMATVLPADATDKTVSWESTDNSVATVSGGVVRAIAPGTTYIKANAGGFTANCTVTVNKISVTSITLASSLNLSVGGSQKLTATVNPSNATNKEVTWSTSDASVANVAQDGTVNGLKEGTATITVTSKDNSEISATCAVTVAPVPVTGISLNQSALTLTEGDTGTLTATLSPETATDKTVIWTTTNSSVATVSGGVVTAVAPGDAQILATANGHTATCNVHVNEKIIDVSSISLSGTGTLSLAVGSFKELTATVLPANATNKEVTWSTSDASIASVTQNGRVSGESAGTATITVTSKANSTISASCTVTVSIPVTKVTLNQSTVTLTEGGSTTLTATVEPITATNTAVTWSSSNTSAATVSSSGVVTAVAAGNTQITATSVADSSISASCTVVVKPSIIDVTSIALNKITATISEKETLTLEATVAPEDATNKTLTWSSSNTSVATVTSAGVVTGVAEGTAIITAMSNNSVTRSCTVTVNKLVVNATAVSLNKSTMSLIAGGNETLTATITPSDATNKTIAWSSSATSIATVSGGTVTAVAAGTATITATTNNGLTATCEVTVTPATIDVTAVTLSKTSTALTVGGTETITATVTPSDATNQTITWASSNTSVATVSGGTIKAVAAGTTTITATSSNGKSASCTVTVSVATVDVTSLSMSKTSASLNIGGSTTLTVTVTPTNATNQNITWSSSNTGVATVSGGTVKAVSAGTATITATSTNGKTATCTVTVKAISVTGVSLNKTSTKIIVGNSETLKATVSPSNATKKSVTWSSSNKAVATVSSSGKVTGVAAGEAVITVKTNDGSKTATCTVTVVTIPLTGIAFKDVNTSLLVGKTEKLNLEFTPADATNKKVTWTSSKPAVATVSAEGTLTAVSAGSTVITAKSEDGGKTATCVVTVNDDVAGVYKITNTGKIEWKKGTAEGLTITSEADFDKFDSLYIDDEKVAVFFYSVEEGSTIITLSTEYLETLDDGTHTIEIVSTDGKATTEFTIIPKCTHSTTYLVNEKKATCQREGYSGDVYCSECNEKLEEGKVIPIGDHTFENGACSECGFLDPNAEADTFNWKDIMQKAAWGILGVGAIVLVAVIIMIIKKTRNKKDNDEFDDEFDEDEE